MNNSSTKTLSRSRRVRVTKLPHAVDGSSIEIPEGKVKRKLSKSMARHRPQVYFESVPVSYKIGVDDEGNDIFADFDKYSYFTLVSSNAAAVTDTYNEKKSKQLPSKYLTNADKQQIKQEMREHIAKVRNGEALSRKQRQRIKQKEKRKLTTA